MVLLKLNLETANDTREQKEIEVPQVPRVGDVITVENVSVGLYFIVSDVILNLDTSTAIVNARHTSHLRHDQASARREMLFRYYGFEDVNTADWTKGLSAQHAP